MRPAPFFLRRIMVWPAAFALLALAPAETVAQEKSAWSLTGSVGLAAPLGAWRSDLNAGQEYRLSLSRRRGTSPWIFEAEVATHPFDFSARGLASRNDGSTRGYIRQTSVGLGVRRVLLERPAVSSWLSGGLSLHSIRTSAWRDTPLPSPTLLRDEFVPGFHLGTGVALARWRVQPVFDVRLQYVTLSERPLLSVPIAVGLRF